MHERNRDYPGSYSNIECILHRPVTPARLVMNHRVSPTVRIQVHDSGRTRVMRSRLSEGRCVRKERTLTWPATSGKIELYTSTVYVINTFSPQSGVAFFFSSSIYGASSSPLASVWHWNAISPAPSSPHHLLQSHQIPGRVGCIWYLVSLQHEEGLTMNYVRWTGISDSKIPLETKGPMFRNLTLPETWNRHGRAKSDLQKWHFLPLTNMDRHENE